MYKTQRASASSGAVAVTVAPGHPWRLIELRFHNASGSLAATKLTATMDAGAGAKHDALVYSVSMSSNSNLRKAFTPPLTFSHEDDELDFAYLNGSGAAYGFEIVYELIV